MICSSDSMCSAQDRLNFWRRKTCWGSKACGQRKGIPLRVERARLGPQHTLPSQRAHDSGEGWPDSKKPGDAAIEGSLARNLLHLSPELRREPLAAPLLLRGLAERGLPAPPPLPPDPVRHAGEDDRQPGPLPGRADRRGLVAAELPTIWCSLKVVGDDRTRTSLESATVHSACNILADYDGMLAIVGIPLGLLEDACPRVHDRFETIHRLALGMNTTSVVPLMPQLRHAFQIPGQASLDELIVLS
mmetsp:Transcript_36410/g.49675  ORF Transcript_36410/g.49675 Transcript_36410/m.49675 type:complete len:246 (+) Transcript_36410:47-784(+)